MKDQLTMPVGCNADGSEKFKLIHIGNQELPRYFRKKYARNYGLDYHVNEKHG